MTNKIKSFFNAKYVLTFFLFIHFTLICLALLFGRYAGENFMVRIASLYQTHFFTQNWRLFASTPYDLTLWCKVNGKWINTDRHMKWRDEKKRVWIYNAIHYFLNQPQASVDTLVQQIENALNQKTSAIMMVNKDKRLSFRYVYFHREQNTYIWKKLILY